MYYESYKLLSWKEKAKFRAIEKQKLRKRIIELIKSRLVWKEKFKVSRKENERLKKELSKQKKIGITKIKHHTYRAEEIGLYVHLRNKGGCSLRGCVRIIKVLLFVLDLDLSIPDPSSIRNWEIKLGLAKVTERCKSPQSDWVVIIDESISVGSQKVLLLLGVNLDTYKFEKALSMSDVEVLDIRIQKSWKAEEINKVLKDVMQRGFCFKYCCCDNGNNLRKLLKMNNLEHIEDCGHAFGNLLKKRYKDDKRYQAFSNKRALFNKQNALGKYAVFLPPKLRTKGRFMNLWATCKWAYKVLHLAKQYEKSGEEKESFNKIKWILEYEDLILELEKEQSLINEVNKILKKEGLCEASIKKCKKKIDTSCVSAQDPAQKSSQGILEYFDRNFSTSTDKNKKICSSDIIESMFGKFKYKLGDTQATGLTEGSLAIANYGSNFSVDQIKKAMEDKKIIDILDWRKENLPTSLNRKRMELFKNVG